MQAQISVEVQKESMGTILITLFFLKVHEREPMRLSCFLRSSSCYFYAAFMSSSFFNSYHQPLNLPFVKRLTGAIKNIWDGKWMVWSVFDLLHFWFLQMHCILQQHKVGGVAIICAKIHLYFASHVVSFHVVVFGQPECQGSNPLATFDHACIFVWNGTTPQTVSCLGFVLLISPLGVGMLLSSLPSCLYRILAKQAMGMAAVSRPTPKTSCLRAWLLVISLR